MHPPYTQQAYGQRPPYPSTPSHNSGSGYPSHPLTRVTDFMTPGSAQRVVPSYNAHSYTTDIYRDQPVERAEPGYGNDAYGGGPVSGYGSNHAMAGSRGTLPAPQPLQNGDCSMPSIPNSNLRQGEPYYARYRFGTDQVPGPTMSFSPHLSEADPNQNAFSEWRLPTCWVNHTEELEDGVHPTCSNDAYGRSSISGPNYAMAGSRGTPALQHGDYGMPSIPYSHNLRQDKPYDAGPGFHFGTGKVPSPKMSFSPRLPEARPNQDASREWRFHTCWVSHAEEDEIHLTIALKKS